MTHEVDEAAVKRLNEAGVSCEQVEQHITAIKAALQHASDLPPQVVKGLEDALAANEGLAHFMHCRGF